MSYPTIAACPLSRAQADRLYLPLHAITNRARLQILSILAATPNVRQVDLEEPLGLTQSTIAHHIRILRSAGLVIQARGERTAVHLRLAPGALAAVAAAITAGGAS